MTAQAVAADKLELRLKLDEGAGTMLRNSAPNAAMASFETSEQKPVWGETTWLWPDFRMDANTRVMLGQTADYDTTQAFVVGGWMMLRSTPNNNGSRGETSLISKMDMSQHGRGWSLSLKNGVISVDLVNEEPVAKPEASAKVETPKEQFVFPTPVGLVAEDEARKKAEKEKEAKAKKPPTPEEVRKAIEKAADKENARKKAIEEAEAAKDKTPRVEIKVSTTFALPLDGKWQHVFFTYDGSGKAAGVKLYLNGAPAATKVVTDTLGKATIRTAAPMQLGWRYPDKNPQKEARFQDLRVYGRALAADEVRRLPFEDYVAELAAKIARWT